MMKSGQKMTKGELIKALEGLDDDARILIDCNDIDTGCLLDILYYEDKVTGDKLQNEITLVCGV